MKELIQITQNAAGVQVVSARELYEFLGLNKAVFARWAKTNITGNEFAAENEDWVGFNIMLNGNDVEDYALTVDFSKRLSMMARTEKGEQARQYFIACEKRLNAITAPAPMSSGELILMLAKQNLENERRLSGIEMALQQLQKVQADAHQELFSLPQPTQAMPDMTIADEVRKMVNAYASAKLMQAQDVWRALYREMYYRYKISVNARKPAKGESKLQMLVRAGHIEKLHTVALHTLRVEKTKEAYSAPPK